MNTEKTHWKKQFNYDYLGSYSLEDGSNSKDVVLTISEIKKVDVVGENGKKEPCTVAYFVEKADWIKPMILNRTNCKNIEKALSTPFIEEWSGKKIQIGIERGIKAFGEYVDALRVRPKVPNVVKPELTETIPAFKNAVEHIKKGGDWSTIESRYTVSETMKTKIKELAK